MNAADTALQIYAFLVLVVAFTAGTGAQVPAVDAMHGRLLAACENGDSLRVMLEPARTRGTIVLARLETPHGIFTVRKHIPFPLYRAVLADLDGDGIPELLLGVVKATRFDRHVRRRLFVYAIRNGALRSVWLGSRVAMPLRDFAVLRRNGSPMLATLERERNGRSAIGMWTWTSFGPRFVTYEARSLSRAAGLRAFRALIITQEEQ